MLKVTPRPSLTQIGRRHGTDKAMPHHNYTPYYEGLFGGWRLRSDLKLLEIGIQQGRSIRTWRDYFPYASIYCLDHNQWCVDGVANIEGVHAACADAADWRQLDSFLARHAFPQFNIIIDDGSHIPLQQWSSFLKLYDSLAPGGYYVVEDLDAPFAFSGGRHPFIDNIAGLISDSLVARATAPFEVTFVHHVATIKKS